MKLLALLLLMLALVWLWRRGRRIAPPGAAKAPRLAPPQRMLACAACGTHVPACDAVAGRRGSYCCARHRREAEGE